MSSPEDTLSWQALTVLPIQARLPPTPPSHLLCHSFRLPLHASSQSHLQSAPSEVHVR